MTYKNPEDKKQYQKQYYQKHKEELKQNQKQYRQEHKEEQKQYQQTPEIKLYYKLKHQTPEYKLQKSIYNKNKYDSLIINGLCTRCGKPSETNTVTCNACKEKRHIYQKNKRYDINEIKSIENVWE